MAVWEVRKVLKRLSRPERDEQGREVRETKEIMKPFARMLAKASHACPLQVCGFGGFEALLSSLLLPRHLVPSPPHLTPPLPPQVLEVLTQLAESYSNQIEPIADAMRYLTPMAFDALTFVILSRLALDRDKVKDDGINISEWLQNLSTFNAAVSLFPGSGRVCGG